MTATPSNAAEAAALLLERRKARRDLVSWARVCGFEPARHHIFLLQKLEAVLRGEIKRLIVCMPPGSAKSTYSSVIFPPFFLAQRPKSNILACSHSTDLATTFGRWSRNLLADKESVLGIKLRTDTQAADEWATTEGGFFFCAGVGSKIAGRRADLGLIDDPVGSREDAYSKVIRDKTWNWFKTDFRTRLKPNASIVLIQTRWHEDDLAGRLLATEGDEWTVINLPMLAKENDPLGRTPGQMLWEGYFTPELLADAQKDSSTFSALYQQDPTPEDGDYFRREWIEAAAYDRNELPPAKSLVHYFASDHALSERTAADSSVILHAGMDEHGVLWLLPDLYWGKDNTLKVCEEMLSRMDCRDKGYSIRTWFAESDNIGKSIGPFLRRMMREQGIFCYIEEMKPAKDKQTRAQSIRARLQAGMVRFPKFAPWYGDALSQMLKFPAATHDDFIDPLAYLGLGLDTLASGRSLPRRVDESIYFQPKPITLKWVKDSDRQRRREQELAALDN